MNQRHRGEQESPIEAQLVAPPYSHQPISTAVDRQPESRIASELIQSRAAVLAILFFVTGALGIPLLWMNRKFSDNQRITWAIIVTIYTLILIGIVVAILMWSYRRVFG